MISKTDTILEKALAGEEINQAEGLWLFQNAALSSLMLTADTLRQRKKPGNIVSWIIDRNINITNVCCSGCLFCNFYTSAKSTKAYITSLDEYEQKIQELMTLGGRQVLLQGGMHPQLGLSFYTDLFQHLKKHFPELKLHALGPPEVVYLAQKEGISLEQTLAALQKAGLDSLPGAGAEILSDRVRQIISKGKCATADWLEVMRIAHQMSLTTSATMMFGHIETQEERIQHLVLLRDLQKEKPHQAKGFISFTAWPFQDQNTQLKTRMQISNQVSNAEYIRMLALSRIMLHNIDNIQVSWLTIGRETAQICLHAGANDMSSIMIEENVVSAAGANHQMDSQAMMDTISQAGFIPLRRDQQYQYQP